MEPTAIIQERKHDDCESANLFCAILEANEVEHFKKLNTVYYVEENKKQEN